PRTSRGAGRERISPISKETHHGHESKRTPLVATHGVDYPVISGSARVVSADSDSAARRPDQSVEGEDRPGGEAGGHQGRRPEGGRGAQGRRAGSAERPQGGRRFGQGGGGADRGPAAKAQGTGHEGRGEQGRA